MSERITSTMWDVRVGQVLRLGEVQVEVMHKSGQLARLRVLAPPDVVISKEAMRAVPSMADSTPS